MNDEHQDDPINLLFVCSRNQWRSPTAEAVWRDHPDVRVRSGGTSASARRRISAADIRWAHVIFVMEEKHKKRLVAEHREAARHTPFHVLDIPDEFELMDEELVDRLRTSVSAYLGFDERPSWRERTGASRRGRGGEDASQR